MEPIAIEAIEPAASGMVRTVDSRSGGSALGIWVMSLGLLVSGGQATEAASADPWADGVEHSDTSGTIRVQLPK
jgi:hypothetical protein